jgi:hypothetical protein
MRALTGVPALVETTDQRAGALTVAGQRRIPTVFPSILAIFSLVLDEGSADGQYAIKQTSMTSTIKTGVGG